jgi:imidazolonepropionase-like amidohydrolase
MLPSIRSLALLAFVPRLLTAQADPVTAITGVTVIDVRAGIARPGSTVVIEGNRIRAVGPAASISPPAGARVIDGTGKYLIPGLWDLHVHLGTAGEEALPFFIASGVTGVRDMGSEQFEPLRQWRVEILSGRRVGPRIVAAGPIVDGPTPNWPLRVTVRDTAEASRTVDSLAGVGVDFIKVHQQLARETYFAVAARARRLDLHFAGHVPVGVSGIEASNAGQRSLEHGTGVPDAVDSAFARTVATFRRNGTWVSPTLAVYWSMAHLTDSSVLNDPRIATLSRSMRDFWEMQKSSWSGDLSLEAFRKNYRQALTNVKALHAAGVPLLASTDLAFINVYPGSSVHEELEHLVEAGLGPLDALRTATLNPARYFAREHELGTVEQGRLADLVLLDANPLQSIQNTRRISVVISNGRVHDRAELDRITRHPQPPAS